MEGLDLRVLLAAPVARPPSRNYRLLQISETGLCERPEPNHAPRSLLETQSEIARDHSNHDDDADDVENHRLIRLEC
jgi:hypothetical protein